MMTGSIAVAAFWRIFRHTSYPLMPGIMTSSKTSAGCSLSIFSSASAPLAAVTTA